MRPLHARRRGRGCRTESAHQHPLHSLCTVGAGHARPAAFPLPTARLSRQGRACPAPTSCCVCRGRRPRRSPGGYGIRPYGVGVDARHRPGKLTLPHTCPGGIYAAPTGCFGQLVGAAYMRPAGVRKAGVHDLCRGPGMPGPYRCITLYRFASFPATSPDRPLMTSTSTSRTTAVP